MEAAGRADAVAPRPLPAATGAARGGSRRSGAGCVGGSVRGRSSVVSRWSSNFLCWTPELGAGSCLWISSRNKFVRRVFRFAEIGAFGGHPPSPWVFETLAGRGVYKKCLQNLDSKELRGQNLENNRLRASPTGLTALRPARS